jgi:hypothetical protein
MYSPNPPPGYVVDIQNGTVAKFANIAPIPDPYDPEPPPYEPNIISLPVEPDIATFIHNLSVLTNGNTLVITDTSDPAGLQAGAAKSAAETTAGANRTPNNAYENIMRSDLEEMVTRMVLLDTQNIEFYFAEVLATSQTHDYFDFEDVPLVVTFKFRDGSSTTYKYNSTYHRWTRVPKKSIDNQGNVIPEKKEEVFTNQPFDFIDVAAPDADTNINWFRWLTESFGVPVIDMRPGSGGGGIVCVDGQCYIQAW